MPNRFRLTLRALAALTLTAGGVALAVHHDPRSAVSTHGTLLEPHRSTTTTTTLRPSATTAPTTTSAPAEIGDAVTVTRPAPTTTAPPEPEPAPADTSDDVHAAIAAHFADMYAQALGVARCESTLIPTAVSRDRANWGLFQINTVHRGLVEQLGYRWDQILDPYVNAAVARALYDESGGWGPWACRWAAR